MTKAPSPWLTTEEAAERLRKTPLAFRTWKCRHNQKYPKRQLKAYVVGEGRRRLYRVTDIDRFVDPAQPIAHLSKGLSKGRAM